MPCSGGSLLPASGVLGRCAAVLFRGQLTLVLCKPNNNNLAASLWEAGPGSGLVTVGGQLCFVVVRSLAGGLYAEILVVAVLLVEGQRSAADRSTRVQPACLLRTDWLRPVGMEQRHARCMWVLRALRKLCELRWLNVCEAAIAH